MRVWDSSSNNQYQVLPALAASCQNMQVDDIAALMRVRGFGSQDIDVLLGMIWNDKQTARKRKIAP